LRFQIGKDAIEAMRKHAKSLEEEATKFERFSDDLFFD
jgi:hypothetical protein